MKEESPLFHSGHGPHCTSLVPLVGLLLTSGQGLGALGAGITEYLGKGWKDGLVEHSLGHSCVTQAIGLLHPLFFA